MHLDDTIAAIATPAGRGGIGVVRLAGAEARAIAASMLRFGGRAATLEDFEAGRARFGELVEPSGAKAPLFQSDENPRAEARGCHQKKRQSSITENEENAAITGNAAITENAGNAGNTDNAENTENTEARRIDEVVVTFFAKPHSYTTDDIVEISAHGSPVVLRHMVELALARGARLAEPGEFTMRAFLNGRIDLTQAEAVRDLIESQTLYQAKVAAQQLEGAVSHRLQPIKQKLVELIAVLEAGIDFADDDVPVAPGERILEGIAAVRAPLEQLAQSFAYGKLVHEGLTLAIVGRPNVGKSSLFNRLVERERAIVTATPGTTRDLVTETVAIGGIPVRLVDTAGIREALDEAESIGIRKSLEAIADANIVLVVLDASQPRSAKDAELLEQVEQRAAIVVENKIDIAEKCRSLASRQKRALARDDNSFRDGNSFRDDNSVVTGGVPRLAALARDDSSSRDDSSFGRGDSSSSWASCSSLCVRTSAVTGEGIGELRAAILRHVGGDGQQHETGFLTNVRHQALVRDSLAALRAAATAVEENVPHEMLLLDLYNALRPLDEITGATTADDILNLIFSSFCIGK